MGIRWLALVCVVALLQAGTEQTEAQIQKGAKAAGNTGPSKSAGVKLSPERQAQLKRMPRIGSRARAALQRNLELEQQREDAANALAAQQAEAARKEAARKTELRKSAADANSAIKEKAAERATRVRERAADGAKGVKRTEPGG